MTQRMNFAKGAPGHYQAMMGLETAIQNGVLEKRLLHMIKLRASQVNGCAFCIDMHWKDCKAAGETDLRLYSLNAWRESPFYSEKERAALAWTEALTRIADSHAPDADFEEARAHFREQELSELSWAIAAINAWNRMAIGFRVPPGSYTPGKAG